MKTILYIILLIFQVGICQEGLYNFGNIKIHDQGVLGFHTHLINDGNFENNEGFAGFYHAENELTVSGNNRAVFKDLEIAVVNDLILETSLGVRTSIDFIAGRIITPRDNLLVTLDFLDDSIFFDTNSDRYIDGYSQRIGMGGFLFPVGDNFRFSPVGIEPELSSTTSFVAAYFFENPNSPSTFSTEFNTENFESILSIVNDKEFWDVNGDIATNVFLSWDEASAVTILADKIEDLRVVGFSIEKQQWVNLGNDSTTGSLIDGNIKSAAFIPNEYEIITLGSVLEAGADIVVYDIVTPNNDGFNDTFIIKGLDAYPENEVFIYNRWGVEVYSKKRYDNTFEGISEARATVEEQRKLPVGTYYYVIKISGREDIAGPLYINR